MNHPRASSSGENTPASESPAPYAGAQSALLAWGLCLLVFFVHGAWPVPDVNESHYLVKAQVHWGLLTPEGDVFLESRDAHPVFFFLWGWTCRLLSPEAATWLGRLACWALLAWGWCRLGRSVGLSALGTVLAAALLVAGNAWGNLSQEWIVGGLEAKSPAYGLVLWGFSAALGRRWGAAWLLLGAATALHPLVGGWNALLLLAAWPFWHRKWRRELTPVPPKSWLGGLLLGGAISLAGLLPALALCWGVDAETAAWASRAYVYHRLRHHLYFPAFPWGNRLSFLGLAVVGAGAYFLLRRSSAWLLLGRITLGAVLLAAAGAALGLAAPWDWDTAAWLLRYYWFRPGDLWVPALVALAATALMERTLARQSAWGSWLLLPLLLLAGGHLVQVVWQRHHHRWPRAEAHMSREQFDAWVQVCRRAGKLSGRGEPAVFLTPRYTQTFHWYARRAEVVNWKDVPQDAPSLVRWWRRLVDLYDYRRLKGTGPWEQLPPDQLLRLARRYGASWAIVPRATGREYPFPVEFANEHFVLYRLPAPGKSPLPRRSAVGEKRP